MDSEHRRSSESGGSRLGVRPKLRVRGLTDVARRFGVIVLSDEIYVELTARLAYVNFDAAQALAAAETLSLDQPIATEFLERYCASTLEAVARTDSRLRGASLAQTPARP